jgi:hypothetical protein
VQAVRTWFILGLIDIRIQGKDSGQGFMVGIKKVLRVCIHGPLSGLGFRVRIQG